MEKWVFQEQPPPPRGKASLRGPRGVAGLMPCLTVLPLSLPPTDRLSPAVRGQGGPLTSSIQDHRSGQRAEPGRVNGGYGGASRNPEEGTEVQPL